jgi:hypothetical protein
MAKIFPDVAKMSVVFASNAEKIVYEIAEKLENPWRVYYSCTLSMKDGDSGIKDGEIDFVFYHPSYGIVVVEVKGGRVSLDGQTGQFYSENRHGRSFAIRNPFQQAISFRNRFLRFLRSNDIQVPVSHAVCFPQVDEKEFPPHVNIEPSTLLGRTGLEDLAGTLARVVNSFHSESFLKFTDVSEALDNLLVGSTFKSRPLLREYIDTQEARVQELDNLHDMFVSPMMGSSRLGVEGGAGTGKTMIASGLANQFGNIGKRVLMLVSSPLLASHIRNSLNKSVEVKTFQEFSSSFGVNLVVAPSDYDKSADHWIQYEAPERLRTAIEASATRYDVLLVDEAQDVQPFWWIALEAMLASKTESKLYVFFDRSQGVFGGGEGASLFKPEDVLPVPSQYIILSKNYRNTAEIAQFAMPFKRDVNAAYDSDRIGYRPSIISYSDTSDGLLKLNSLVKSLAVDHGIKEDEVVILSARAPDAKESMLVGQDKIAGLRVSRITPEGVSKNQLAQDGEIGVATIAAFKGLEAKIVIVVNMSEHKMSFDNPIMSSLAYVALTRAKHMLYVFVKEGDDKAERLVKSASAIKPGGSMVLDAEDRPGEFSGTVSHYNPGRLGILEISSEDNLGKTILVLPSDVERAGLKSLTKGQILRFRIRSEGGVATATSLAEIQLVDEML